MSLFINAYCASTVRSSIDLLFTYTVYAPSWICSKSETSLTSVPPDAIFVLYCSLSTYAATIVVFEISVFEITKPSNDSLNILEPEPSTNGVEIYCLPIFPVVLDIEYCK